jgi:hypothetical protein
MRASMALALAAVSALLVAGCSGSGKTTTGPTKPVRTPVRNVRGPVVTAPTSFKIEPQNAAQREKTAATICDGIAAKRKERIEQLVHLLINGQPVDKLKAAGMLGDLCDPMATPFLMTRLKDEPNRDVRLACLSALGHIADPSSAKVVIEFLDDEDLGIATVALDALSEMTKADPPYAFVDGTTIKVRKAEKEVWLKKLEEGFFKPAADKTTK